jgi:hypothetical protein
MDDNMRRIAPIDLLAVNGVSADAIAEMTTAPSKASSPAPISSPGRAAVIACAMCRGAGRVLVDEAEALAAGWIPLERRAWFGGWRVEVPCPCPAGAAVVAAWQQLPEDAAGVTLESLFDIPEQDQALMVTEAFCASPTGWLSFAGDYGVGKTALLYAALNRLSDARRYGRYITAPELIDKLRNLIRNGGDPDRYLGRWCDAPLIAIDELDKYDPTEFADKSIFRLFNARYQRWQTTGTLLAYNLDRESRLPPFLRSRIHDGRFRFVRLAGADVRPALGGEWETGETYA